MSKNVCSYAKLAQCSYKQCPYGETVACPGVPWVHEKFS